MGGKKTKKKSGKRHSRQAPVQPPPGQMMLPWAAQMNPMMPQMMPQMQQPPQAQPPQQTLKRPSESSSSSSSSDSSDSSSSNKKKKKKHKKDKPVEREDPAKKPLSSSYKYIGGPDYPVARVHKIKAAQQVLKDAQGNQESICCSRV